MIRLIFLLIGLILVADNAAIAFTAQTQLTVSSVIQTQTLSNSIMTAPASGTVGTLSTTCSTQSACSSPSYQLANTGNCSIATKNADFVVLGNTLSVNPSGPDIRGGGLPSGSYPIGIATIIAGTYNSGICFSYGIVVNSTSSQPTISINGSTTGTTVTSGSTMTVAVSNGPGHPKDQFALCGNGCGTWLYMDPSLNGGVGGCVASGNFTSTTCSAVPVPSVTGNWTANFFLASEFGGTQLAVAPFTVTAGTTPSITGVSLSNDTVVQGFSGTVGSLTTACSVSPCPGAANYSIPGVSPTLTGITLNDHSAGTDFFTCGLASTIGPIAVQGTGNIGGATLSLDLASQNNGFSLSSIVVPSNLHVSASPTGCPTNYNVQVTATQAGASGSPLSQTFTVTGSGSGGGTGTCTSSIGGPSPPPCPVGVAAPNGYHWDLTFDTEFTQLSSLPSAWQTCNSNPLYWDGTKGVGLLPISGSAPDALWRACIKMSTTQVYGYFETGARYPTDNAGEGDGYHPDIWNRPNLSDGSWSLVSESDICEILVYLSGSLCHHYLHDNTTANTLDFTYGVSPTDGAPHAYGWYRRNDGGCCGSEQVYFDGNPEGSAYSLGNGWAPYGYSWLISQDGCSYPYPGGNPPWCSSTSDTAFNPVWVQYFRAWDLVSGGGGGGTISADGSTITAPTSSTLTTSAGTWGFGSASTSWPGQYDILLNGSPIAYDASRYWGGNMLLVYNSGSLYFENNANQWWVYAGGTGSAAFQSTTDPRGGAGGTQTITVNGSSTGTTVSAGASVTVAVNNVTGNTSSWIGFCQAAGPFDHAHCDALYAWEYLSCTPFSPPKPLTSASCSLSAPSSAGSYVAGYFPNNTYPPTITASLTVTGGGGGGGGCTGGPCIAVNGSTTGITVSPGASLSLQVTGGDTSTTDDWMSFCTNLGGPPTVSAASCADTASSPGPYQWVFMPSCTQHAPPFNPYFDGNTNGAGSCTLTAPSTPGSYFAAFFNNDGYNGAACGGNSGAQTACVATAPVTVSSGGGGVAYVKGVKNAPGETTGSGNDCVWTTSSPPSAGDTLVGFSHIAYWVAASPISITDNAGNSYSLSGETVWDPYGEHLMMWYKSGISGSPTVFNFHFANTYNNTFCNVGFVEYSGATAVDTITGPVKQTTLHPSMTMSPSAASSLLWVFSATDTEDSYPCQDGGNGNMISPSNYVVLNDLASSNGICILGSPSPVGPSPITFTWTDTYYNASNCSDTSPGPCSTVMMGASVH